MPLLLDQMIEAIRVVHIPGSLIVLVLAMTLPLPRVQGFLAAAGKQCIAAVGALLGALISHPDVQEALATAGEAVICRPAVQASLAATITRPDVQESLAAVFVRGMNQFVSQPSRAIQSLFNFRRPGRVMENEGR